MATIIAWLILALPPESYDPLKTPTFFWYYRGDPRVVKALASGGIAGTGVTATLLYFISKRLPPLHGAARFAREAEIKQHGFRSDQGIILGQRRGRFLVFGGSEHVMLEAPTRSGKGVGVVIPNLLSWQGSVVVLDVKQENFAASAGFRARHGQQVFLFNPADKHGRTARFNPLSYIDRTDPDQVIVELQQIATMLFVPPERGEAFWIEAARTGFIGVGAYLAQIEDRPFTLGEIYRTMTQGDVRARLRRVLADDGDRLSPACRAALTDFSAGADNTFASIVQTVTSKLGLWLNPLLDRATSASDFDLRNIRSKPMSIYLGVSPDELDRVAPLYNLFFQQLIALNVRRLPGDDTPIQLLVILDEFARLGRASVLASAFSYVAGYGIRLLAVIQSRAQLRAVYGPDVTDEIVANCGVEIIFTPKELRVANELSERIGYVGRASTTRSLTINGLFANRSKSISEQRRALLLPQELLQFPADELLLLRGGMPPIGGKKLRYFANSVFKKRLAPPPDIDGLDASQPPPFMPEFADPQESELAAHEPWLFDINDLRIVDEEDMLRDIAPMSGSDMTLIIEEGDIYVR